MAIRTISTLALYCPRCGKIEMHTFSRFQMKAMAGRQLICSCGQVQATVTSTCSRQYLFDVPCLMCGTSHAICLDANRFWQAMVDKIYCVEENLELGFLGERRTIEATIADQQHELERLMHELDNEEHVDNPQIMFEVLNKVHDIVEMGEVYCACGRTHLEADILPDGIELECIYCGSSRVVRAQTEEDLKNVKLMQSIELVTRRRSRRKN